MVKKYISRQKRYKKRRTSMLRRRSSYSVSRIGLNTMGSRFFPALPARMQLKVPFYGDTKMNTNLFTAGQTTVAASYTNCYYWFMDPLDMNRDILTLGHQASTKFYSSLFYGMMNMYGEAQYRTHHLTMDLTAEYFRVITGAAGVAESTTRTDPIVHFACGPMALQYLRNSVGNLHIATDAGTIFSGVDYYSALTQSPGCKSYTVSTTGDRKPQRATVTIDGFAHNGVAQSAKSNITWTPQTAGNPPSTPVNLITYPNPTDRNVILCAVRVRGVYYASAVQTISLRMALKLDQHMTFIDPYPQFPYTYDGVN